MSVTIRLAKIGRKNLTAYKIIVTNTRSKRNGVYLDIIGTYNPFEKPEFLKFDKDKLKTWTEKGALMSETVKKLVDGNYQFKPYISAKKLKKEAAKEGAEGEKPKNN